MSHLLELDHDLMEYEISIHLPPNGYDGSVVLLVVHCGPSPIRPSSEGVRVGLAGTIYLNIPFHPFHGGRRREFERIGTSLRELPDSGPTLWTEHTRYEPGDVLRANCTSQPSRPKAELTLTLNNMVVSMVAVRTVRINPMHGRL
uniref:Uncharacterized protein n=1 Tax=Anopheles atroparvus TaxID=41427 RepID=A0A182J140_ANOAO